MTVPNYVLPGVAYLPSTYVALLVFCDGIYQIRPRLTSDLTSFFLMWFEQMLLFAAFQSLVYLAVVSFFPARYRSLHKGELLLSSAACGVASAFFFAMSLRIVLALTDQWLIPAIVIAVVAAALPALLVPVSLRRRSSENGMTRTRSTAVLLSSAYAASCTVFLVVAHLPLWPGLHLFAGIWNPEVSSYVPLVLYGYIIVVQLLFECSVVALLLWFLHASVLASLFRRWQNLPQRWFVFGSATSALLAVVIMEAVHLSAVDGIPAWEVDNAPLRWVLLLLTLLLCAATLVLLPTFVIFGAFARRWRQRALAAEVPR